MLVNHHVKALAQLLPRPSPSYRLGQAHISARSLQFPSSRSRQYAAVTAASGQDIGIVGGGITGLAAAHFLRKSGHKVTIYEGSDRLGGWIKSTFHDVDGGQILFESGPRTLRPGAPNGFVVTQMITDLGLEDSLIATPKTAPGARQRWLYYPEHLVMMPGSGQGLWRTLKDFLFEPLWAGAFSPGFAALLVDSRPEGIEDQSIGELIARRAGIDVANNVASAVMHGIYAGDIWRLSAESLMPLIWAVDAVEKPIPEKYEILKSTYKEEDAELWKEILTERPKGFDTGMQLWRNSFYTFQKGMQEFSDALVDRLLKDEGVVVKTGAQVESIYVEGVAEGSSKAQVGLSAKSTPDSEVHPHDQVISTLSHSKFQKLIGNNSQFQKAYSPDAVTVGVVNLYYEDPQLLPVQGFGYLIPQSIPFDQNPECGLGVIFDSQAVLGQDSSNKGTKVTVMMGGHYWDGWSIKPTEDETLQMARSLLKRHLNITGTPLLSQPSLQVDCIPQYRPFHRRKLGEQHSQLLNMFSGKIKVAGSSYTGVGVNDCIRAGLDISRSISEPGWENRTGLERFSKAQEWAKLGPKAQ